ncbi:MAG: D-alanyl-D-alanine carboxypeptidase [Oscillospiraceae bacterium]|jgi:D-alanyl-D-alanine carboxypeptidase (penicillin-binding protein 5/6)|nr:D-alanyl-D-alanine carboxypeptidase [Oscillospiraceae bacterium]
MKRFLASLLLFSAALTLAAPAFAAPGDGGLDGAETVSAVAPDITAPYAILIERETGAVLFEKNADERREPASITKIMTELLTIEALEAGDISLDDIVTASAYAAGMGESQIYLREGEKMTVRDILKAIVINSANDAAVAMAEHLAGSEATFAARMNARAAALGMTDTHFNNASGLFDDPDHYTTARDVAIMSRELISHALIKDFTTIWMDTLRDGAFELANTNKLIHDFEGATGLKTGFTSRAGYCVSATAARDGVEYIAVVLGDAGTDARFVSAAALLNYAFANYTLVSALPDAPLLPIKVELGTKAYVQPTVVGGEKLLVTKADAKTLTKTVAIPDRLTAPVAASDEIGTLTIESGGRTLAVLPLTAGEDAARLSWGAIFGRFVSMLFTPAEF